MNNDDLQLVTWAKELTLLATRHPLKANDLAAAKDLMRKIKACGYTNKEIRNLTSNSWSEATIKLYTRNIGGVQSHLKAEHLALLDRMITEGIEMTEIREGLSLLSDLKKTSITTAELLEMVRYLKDRRTMLPYVVETIAKLRANGISPEKFAELDQYKKLLDSHDVDIAIIDRIHELLEKYQDREAFINSILSYEDLSGIRSEIAKSTKENQEISENLSSLRAELRSLLVEKANLLTEISLAKEISSLGLSSMMLKDLRELAKKYKCNTNGIVEAIAQYSNVAQLKSEVSSLEGRKLQIEESINNLQKELSRLTGLSKISEAFLSKFKFSLYDLNLIYEAASRHGDPSNFLKALAGLSNLQEVEKKIAGLQTEKVSLEVTVLDLRKRKRELELMMEGQRDTAKLAMEQIYSDVGTMLESVTEKVTLELHQSLAELRNTYEAYSSVHAKMQSNKERLRVCSIIRAVMYNDLEAIKDIPPGYLLIFIQGALNICYGKCLNPYTGLEPAIAIKYELDPAMEFQLADLLGLAKNAAEKVKH